MVSLIYTMIEFVKIYGERNTGTNVLQHAIDLNFCCQILPGIARCGEEPIAAHLDALGLSGLERSLFREYLIDDEIARHEHDDLGWKHAAPPLETIGISTRLTRTLFVVITKDPYHWLLSFQQRPYHRLYTEELDFSGFIRHYWITVRRDNLPWTLLKNPVQLYGVKLSAYQALAELDCHFVHLRYGDFLADFEGTMQTLARWLTPKSPGPWTLPLGSLKGDQLNFYDYRRKYADNTRLQAISNQDLIHINAHLDAKLLAAWGYALRLPA